VAKNVAFEIQVYKAGNWRIDSVFDDRALVLFEAKRLESYSSKNSIRVIEETHDEATGQSSVKVIFRSARVATQEQRPAPAPARKKSPPTRAKKDVQPRRRGQKPAASEDSHMGQVIGFALTVAIAGGLIFFLKSFADQL